MINLTDKPSLNSPEFKPSPPEGDSFWSNIKVDISAFVIGSAKCATKWVAQTLRNSEEILIPGECNGLTQRADPKADYYNNFFSGDSRSSGKLILDYSNTYMLDSSLAIKIKRTFGDVKILMMYRDPVERAFSHYLMDLTYGVFTHDGRGFRKAVCEPRSFSYFDFGLYLKHLAPFLEVFGPERVLVVDVDAVDAEPKRVAAELYKFLGVSGSPEGALDSRVNTWEQFRQQYLPPSEHTVARPQLSSSDRQWLAEHYREEHSEFLRALSSLPNVIRRPDSSKR